jgi:hypothetical protein
LHAGNLGLTTNFDFYDNFGVNHDAGQEIDITNGTINYARLKAVYFIKNDSKT